MQADLHGVSAQREAVYGWCAMMKIPREACIEYADEGVSGKTMDRPEWKRLQDDIEHGLIDTVLVYSLDRAGRCSWQTIEWFERMRERNVRIVAVREGLDFSTHIGKLVASILAIVADWQRSETAENTSRGIRARIANGERWGGGRIGIGKPGGRTHDDGAVAAAVDRVRAGESRGAVAREMGVSKKTVSRWVARAG